MILKMLCHIADIYMVFHQCEFSGVASNKSFVETFYHTDYIWTCFRHRCALPCVLSMLWRNKSSCYIVRMQMVSHQYESIYEP